MTDTSGKKPHRGDAKPGEAGREDARRSGDDADPDNAKDAISKRLDEGLEETFPSSDPVSVKITK